ncbi:SGNH/GDSL hydrolase family protein [Paenibacillus sp. GD4]|uniref:SGNH/GDSL hydrolase family protein n=1 Tax=Paenibacillus sp. GD4 TaxID=3068890 RepID=UPI002796E169|nr:SGNH/GDSL hydrolase family protein [Paenibacillus sp. GD4]MDQ1910523.1 SGNH/GDSL hydrolase family protein [Paenibacillus sp. GD4]
MIHMLRYGLPYTEERVRTTGRLQVLYLGGSVTVGASSSDHERFSWRALTSARLSTRYPEAECVFTNGGISGTNSTYGVYRLEPLLLPKPPDLVFIEFAVNDAGNRDETVRAVEGMMRKLRLSEPETGIVLVYGATRQGMELYRQGEVPPNIRHMEEVAEHYGLPSVNLCLDIARCIDGGTLAWDDFAGDTVHPYDGGHLIYANRVAELLEASLLQGVCRTVVEPYDSFHYGGAAYAGIGEADPVGSCRHIVEEATGVNRNYKEPVEILHMQGLDAGLRLPFRGTAVGLLYLANQHTGAVRYSIDGSPWKLQELHDGYRDGFSRIRARMLEDELEPGDHVLELRLTAGEGAEPESPLELRIVQFLVNR